MVRCASPKPAPSSTISSSQYGKELAPAQDGEAHWRYRYWLHYAEGSLMPPLLLKLVVNRLGLFGWAARRYVDGQIKLHLDYLEKELDNKQWFAGDAFSAADIMMSFPLEAASCAGRLERVATEPHELSCPHSCAARLSKGAEPGRPVRVRSLSLAPCERKGRPTTITDACVRR